jgi:hypothetical protein
MVKNEVSSRLVPVDGRNNKRLAPTTRLNANQALSFALRTIDRWDFQEIDLTDNR